MTKKVRLWETNILFFLKVIALIFIVFLIVYYYFKSELVENYKEILSQNSKLIESQISASIGDPGKVQEIFDQVFNNELQVAIILPDFKLLAHSKNISSNIASAIDMNNFKSVLDGQVVSFVLYDPVLKENQLYLLSPMRQNKVVNAVLVYAVPNSIVEGHINNLFYLLLIGCLIILGLAFYIVLNFAKKINKPIEMMSENAAHFAQGQFSKKIPNPEILEFEGLANSLNKMSDQLDEKINLIELQKNEIDAILASMSEAILAVDLMGKVIRWNEAFRQLFVGAEDENKNDFAKIIRNKDLEDYITKCLSTNERNGEEIIYLIKQELYMKVDGSFLIDAMGEKYGVVIVLTDITRMKKLEKIRQEFVSNASHEIRTPITSIKGFVETMLTNGIDNKEETLHFLAIVQRQSDRLAAIISDLLLLSSLEEGSAIPLSKTSIYSILSEAVQTCQLQAQQKEIIINLACEKEIDLQINGALIEQAVVNLLMNAVAYSPAKSSIDLIGKFENDFFCITVSDCGIGIPEEHLERLFERFFRVDKSRSRKNGGTGLGLSIVKHIAQVHGGSITVESVLGKGSSFHLKIPSRKKE
jgi:two-component system phosphate regulon sensor histidine kinase PhoR